MRYVQQPNGSLVRETPKRLPKKERRKHRMEDETLESTTVEETVETAETPEQETTPEIPALPVCPFCNQQPMQISMCQVDLASFRLAVMFCGNAKCRKTFNTQIIGPAGNARPILYRPT